MIISTSVLMMNKSMVFTEKVVEFDTILFSEGDKIIKKDGDVLRLSENNGKTYPKAINIKSIGTIKYIYMFDDGSTMICTKDKIYNTQDWTTLNETTVMDIDGNSYLPVSVDNFSSYKNATNKQVVDGVEIFCWGNYTNSHNNINIWYTSDKGKTVKSCFKFGYTTPINKSSPLKCRHVHHVDFNPFDHTFWAQTGDEPTSEDSHWIKGSYNIHSDTWIWEVVGSGDNYKTSNMVFMNGYIYYAWDISIGGVARVPYEHASDPTKHELVFKTPNDCIGIYMGERGDMVAFITRWGGTKKASTLYYSEDLKTFHEIEGILPEYLDTPLTVYYGQHRVNSKGRLLAGIYPPTVPIEDWDRTPSVWIDEIIKNAGFPHALKPLKR